MHGRLQQVSLTSVLGEAPRDPALFCVQGPPASGCQSVHCLAEALPGYRGPPLAGAPWGPGRWLQVSCLPENTCS